MISYYVADIFRRKLNMIGGIFVSIEQIGSAGMQYSGDTGVRVQSAPEKAPVVKRDSASNQQQQYNGDRPSEKQIQDAVDTTNKELIKLETNLRFSVHKKTRQIMVKIIDTNTQEVIKEVPPEKILDMVASMMERAGLIVDRRG